MATLLNKEEEDGDVGGGGGAGAEGDGGGDDNSSVTICGSSISTINSHCYNTQHTTTPSSSSTTATYENLQTKTLTTSANGGSTTNTHNYNSNKAMMAYNASGGGSGDDENRLGCGFLKDYINVGKISSSSTSAVTNLGLLQQHEQQQESPEAPVPTYTSKNLLLCRRFKDSGDSLRNFTSLPLFIYATSPSTHAISADGVGVAQVAVKSAEEAAANLKKVRNHMYIPTYIISK